MNPNLVDTLYKLNWKNSHAPARELIPSINEARETVLLLTQHSGWRERVVAAKVIAAFGLKELVQPLIETFQSNPENYTCRAFSAVIAEFPELDRESLYEKMRSVCPNDSYGKHLLQVIHDAASA